VARERRAVVAPGQARLESPQPPTGSDARPDRNECVSHETARYAMAAGSSGARLPVFTFAAASSANTVVTPNSWRSLTPGASIASAQRYRPGAGGAPSTRKAPGLEGGEPRSTVGAAPRSGANSMVGVPAFCALKSSSLVSDNGCARTFDGTAAAASVAHRTILRMRNLGRRKTRQTTGEPVRSG